MANQIRYQVGFDIQQNNLNQLKASLQQLNKLKIGDIMKINGSDAAAASTTLNNIRKEAARVEDALKAAFNAKLNTVNIETFNKQLSKTSGSINEVYKTFKQAGTAGENAFRSLSSYALSTNIQLKETHNILDKMATTLTNTLKWNVASSAINNMSRSVEQAFGYVKALDTSLNDIRIVTNKTADDMGRFAEKANDVAQSLGKTTVDYTNAALIYAQQGLNDKQIQERAAITLKTANVTGQSTDAVSEELTAVWNGYKVNAEQAELYVDRLAAVAATTASDLEELSTGMSKVASAANLMGVNEEQLAAQLSTIISVTREAPETIGTSLKTIYARISDIKSGIAEDGATLGYYSGKMAEFGVNVLDANGNLRDMGSVMEEIGGKWDTLTREQQIYLTQTMAGQRQYSRLLALFDNWGEYEKALNTARNAAGTLQEQQDIYMESTAAHLQTLKASVENIYDSFADTDTINGLIDGLSTVANLAANFIDAIGGGVTILEGLGSVALTVFSTHIARGINTTITNFEIAKNNAKQFNDALLVTKEWQGIPGLDSVSQKLLESREQLLELSRLMSSEQFSGMQGMLNDVTQVGNAIASLKDEQLILNEAIEGVLSYKDAWKTTEDVMKSDEGQAEVIKRLQKQEQGIKNVIKAINQYSKLQNTMNTKIINGEEISSELEQARKKLIAYYEALEKLGSTGQLTQRHVESLKSIEPVVNEIRNELSTIDDSIDEPAMAAKIQQVIQELRGLATSAANGATQIRQRVETEMGGAVDSLTNKIVELQEKLQILTKKYQESLNKTARAVNFENLTKTVGAITSLAMGIQQLQGLGGIWSEEDVSISEKILDTIISLGFAVPMLTSSLSSLNKIFHFVTVANLESAASMELFDVAMSKGAKQVSIFGKVMAANPLFLQLAALTAIIVAIGAYGKHLEKIKQQTIENAKAEIEQANAKQEEIETNKELYDSIDELNEKYKSGEITRQQLKSQVQDLIQQYGLEGEAAQKLTRDYDNLGTSIRQARKAAAEQAFKSAQNEKDNAETVLSNTSGGRLYTNLDKSTFSSSLSDIIGEFSGETGLGSIYLEGKGDSQIEKTIDLYDKLSQAVKNADKDSKNSSQTYQEVNKWLKENRQAVQAYKNALKDTQKYTGESILNNLEYNSETDFSNIDNFTEYVAQKQILIDKINETLKEQGNTTADAVALADESLKNNFEDLYSKYGETANYIDKLKEKLGAPPKNLNEMLEKLDEKQLSALMRIDPSAVNSWNDVYTAAAQIASIDFSNVDAIKNIEGAQQTASDQYVLYQSLEDQVKSGKTISKSEMKNFEPQIQGFFTMMANGSYKLTGDAEEFYSVVNNLKLDGFHDAINQVNDELSKVGKIQALGEDFNYNSINKQALKEVAPGMSFIKKVDYDLAGQQLEYLKAVTDSNDELNASISLWEKQIKDQKLSKEAVQAIADAVSQAKDQTNGLDEKTASLQEKAKMLKEQLHDAMFPRDEDIDESALNSLAKNLQQLAPNLDGLSDELKQDADTAEDVAEAFLRFDNAIEDVVNHYDEWSQILKNGSEVEKTTAIQGLKDAYGDLLNIDGSALSNDFLLNVNNLQLMKAAIDGDIDAYNQLIDLANQDIIAHLQLSQQDQIAFEEAYNHIKELLNDPDIQQLQVGAHIKDQQFLKTLDQMIQAAGNDTAAIQSLLQNMGVQANLIPVEEEWDDVQEFPQARATWTLEPVQVDLPTGGSIKDVMGSVVNTIKNATLQTDAWTTSIPVHKKVKAYGIDYSSVTKAASGGTKYNQSSNGAGSKGQARRAAAAKSSTPKPSSSKSRSGGSSSSSKSGSSQPDTSQKDFKKTLEDDRDIYHDINVEIEQIERNLQRVQKVQDRLFGKNLLKSLDKQTQILEQHKEKLKEKQALQRQDLASQQAMLKTLGVTFDQYGNIVNYMDVLAQKQNVVNGLVAQYNSLISAYNASTDKDYKDNLNQQIDAVSKQIQNAEEDLKNTKDKIGNYDSLREAIEDITDQIEEETQKQIELNIKKFRMEVEIRLDMGEAQRDWNEFQRNVINHSDILKDTDFSKIFKDAKKDAQDIISYFDVAGSKGTIQKLTEQLNDTRTQLESIERTGSSAIYGDNMKQAQEDLQNDLSQLMNQLEEIENKIDSINESYLETIDDVSTNFDKQIEDYGFITDLIEHDIDLLNLLYGDKNYDAMEKYYTTLQRNQNNEMDALRKQSDFWKRRWDEALEQGDIQAAKKFEENYKKVLNNLNQTILNSVKTLQDKYSNALNKIFDDLDKKLTNGLGTDYLNMEWDLMKQNADEYLDTINAAFAVQGLENKFKKAIDDSNAKNVKAQQALKNLMDDQLGKLRAKEKLTQYDVDRAEKLLQIEQARIALEQAQSSKTSMRLKRDSQGNYSYEYAADENNVSDAQDALSAAQNDLYNFDKAAYEANLKDMLSIYENFREKEKEIRQKHYENEADQQRDLALLQEQYAELMNAKTEENLNIRSNLNNSAFQNLAAMYQTNVSNYQNMAEDEKNILMQNLVPAWTSGIQIMADKIAGQGGFIPACEDAFEQVDEKTREYQNDLDDLARSAGNNLSDVKNGVDEVAYSFEHLIQDNDELTRRMDEEINIIRELRAEVQGTTEDFKSQRDAALAAVDAANLLLQSQRQQAAAEASNYNYGGAGSSSSGTSSGNSSFEWVTDSSDEKDGVISVGDVATFSGRYFYDSWGTSPAGSKLAGIVDAVQVDMLNNNEYGVHIRGAGPYANNVLYEDLGWIKRSQLYGYDTGGYTGAWGSTGRLALLHEKELVLNKEDTRNLLDAVSILRTVMGNFNGNIMTRLDSIKSGFTNILSSNSEELKQDVHIEANFPNVDSKKQIEDAFANLVNIAAQRVMR